MLKKVFVLPFWTLFLLLSLSIVSLPTAAQEAAHLWQAWAAVDVTTITNDDSGSTVAVSEAVVNPQGTPTLEITPSGTSEETKIAMPFTGANLQDLRLYDQIEIEVYLPEENALLPNRFFMGLAETTGTFRWMGGSFSETDVQPGWNRVVYRLDPAMQQIDASSTYTLFLSFFGANEGNNKTPLTEPIYLGSAYLAEPAAATDSDAIYQQEVERLLEMDDDAFLDAIARETFDFFWYEANPDNGLIKDRSTPDAASSIASVGFDLAAIPIGVDRGWISQEQGYERALLTLQTFAGGGVQGEHGFFYHFVDMETGERVWNSEVSSIDTALFLAGALTAGEYFARTDVQALAQQLYEAADWDWMRAGRDFLSMGWTPDEGFLSSSWSHFDESLILYVLAIGSPTHPIPAETWDAWLRPANLAGEYIYLINEPLFVYQYPLAFLNLRGREDAYANYWNNTTRACERNRQFAVDRAERFTTYQNGVWGISASDGPRGYRAYGASSGNHDGTVAPYAAAACLPFTPEPAVEGMRALLNEHGSRVWRDYGFVSAINRDEDWYSTEHIGIDQGDILLMIANYQDSFVWDLFMGNEHIQNALDAMGFIENSGDYAITPGYLAQIRGD